MKKNVNSKCISCMCVSVYVSVRLLSLQNFDMIKDKKYDLFKTYFYSYT